MVCKVQYYANIVWSPVAFSYCGITLCSTLMRSIITGYNNSWVYNRTEHWYNMAIMTHDTLVTTWLVHVEIWAPPSPGHLGQLLNHLHHSHVGHVDTCRSRCIKVAFQREDGQCLSSGLRITLINIARPGQDTETTVQWWPQQSSGPSMVTHNTTGLRRLRP